MDNHYQKLIQWSESNKKFLTKRIEALKRAKRLDREVHRAHDLAFEEVDCLKCANCCKTTGPLLTPQDIGRISKHLRMDEKQFSETYLRVDEDGDHVFRSMPCPFLAADNKCEIYDHRPRACRSFPHTDEKGQAQIMHLTRKNARICPAVSRIFQVIADLDV